MDSSGQNLNIKTRKPYTITKQRERWTEEEHNSFLEALKLYGRAWQRIEEHIGTKSAVQIRSHAQKFFTKLEKEALAKGVPIRQALDMEIPPPRPKRKPNYPYPRKTDPKTHPEVAEKDGKQATLVSSLHSGKHVLDLETKPLAETSGGDEKVENAKTSQEVEKDLLLSQEPPCASLSSKNENSIPCTFREFIPAVEEVINHDETFESYITVETRKLQDGIKHTNITSNTLFFGHENSQKLSPLTNDIQCVQNYPRHVPIQIVDGDQRIPEMSFQESTLDKLGECPNLFVNTNNNASGSSSYQTVPTFHPFFKPFCDNQEDYRSSFLHVSPTISSLIVSSLLQNPAAHAAASFVATFWHPPANSEATSGVSSSRDELKNSEAPSMEAIAAATVAAATAWWAAHGLCPPFYSSYSCTCPFSFGAPVHNNQAGEKAPSEEKMDAQQPEGLAKKCVAMSSSEDDSDGGGDREVNTEGDTKETTPVTDSIKTNVRKQVDRSSCGSNTTSSSEIETEGKEKKEADVNVPCMSRCSNAPNESWKEVSEEGRLAFQALFSREVLPQSFSHSVAEKGQQLDLNKEGNASSSSYAVLRGGELTMGLGNVKLNIHHTGFKPYKRCSIENKTSTGGSGQSDEKGSKRMRLEAQG